MSRVIRGGAALVPPGVDPALRRRIYRRILSRVRNPGEAEDLTQETLVKVHRGLPHFRGDSDLGTWALRIAGNVVNDHFRHAASHPAESASPPEEVDLDGLADPSRPGPEALLERGISEGCLQKALEVLPGAYREAFDLHDLRGIEIPEIARRLGVPISTVKIRVHRARRRLRSICESQCEPYRDGEGNVACCPKEPEPK